MKCSTKIAVVQQAVDLTGVRSRGTLKERRKVVA